MEWVIAVIDFINSNPNVVLIALTLALVVVTICYTYATVRMSWLMQKDLENRIRPVMDAYVRYQGFSGDQFVFEAFVYARGPAAAINFFGVMLLWSSGGTQPGVDRYHSEDIAVKNTLIEAGSSRVWKFLVPREASSHPANEWIVVLRYKDAVGLRTYGQTITSGGLTRQVPAPGILKHLWGRFRLRYKAQQFKRRS